MYILNKLDLNFIIFIKLESNHPEQLKQSL